MKRIGIVGAGALGAGYLYPLLSENNIVFLFDKNLWRYDINDINDLLDYDLDVIVTATNPLGYNDLPFNDINCPVIGFENTYGLKDAVPPFNEFYYGVADVLAIKEESTISVEKNYPYCVFPHNVYVGDNVQYMFPEQMEIFWHVRLLMHNTVHCSVAYMGYKYEYVHEAINDEAIRTQAWEILHTVKQLCFEKYGNNPVFNSEMVSRFVSTELLRYALFKEDKISRVARDPERKLAPNERLVGVWDECLYYGIDPEPLRIPIEIAISQLQEVPPYLHEKFSLN